MLGIDDAFLIAGANLLGGMMTNESNQDISSANNAFNAEQAALNREFQWNALRETQNFNNFQADKQMNFQQYNADTQYTRAVQDLKMAGLNPMLAMIKGGNASPPGAMASSTAPSGSVASSAGNPTMRDVISPAITSAFALTRMKEEISNMREQNENLQATRRNIDADTQMKLAQVPNINQQTETSATQAHLNMQQLENMGQALQKLKEETNNERLKGLLIESQRYLNYADEQYRRGQINMQGLEKQYKEIYNHLIANAVPKSDNDAEAQRSWFMRNIAPYMPSVLQGGNALSIFQHLTR